MYGIPSTAVKLFLALVIAFLMKTECLRESNPPLIELLTRFFQLTHFSIPAITG